MHAAESASPALTGEPMLQEDTIMGTAGSARPARPASESSEEPDLELGKRLSTLHVCCKGMSCSFTCRWPGVDCISQEI